MTRSEFIERYESMVSELKEAGDQLAETIARAGARIAEEIEKSRKDVYLENVRRRREIDDMFRILKHHLGRLDREADPWRFPKIVGAPKPPRKRGARTPRKS